jgi:hypothetical protein
MIFPAPAAGLRQSGSRGRLILAQFFISEWPFLAPEQPSLLLRSADRVCP